MDVSGQNHIEIREWMHPRPIGNSVEIVVVKIPNFLLVPFALLSDVRLFMDNLVGWQQRQWSAMVQDAKLVDQGRVP